MKSVRNDPHGGDDDLIVNFFSLGVISEFYFIVNAVRVNRSAQKYDIFG